MPRQDHYATSHHFDLRLERDGVLVSWAVPRFGNRIGLFDSRSGAKSRPSRRAGEDWLVHKIEPEGG